MSEDAPDQTWNITLDEGPTPIHERLALAIAGEIRSGRLAPGSRLPAHRALATHVGVSVGTVTRAYGQLANDGLVVSDRGRGMFVAEDTAERNGGIADLSLNVPPPLLDAAELERLMLSFAHRSSPMDLCRYDPVQGSMGHRRLLAGLIHQLRGLAIDPELLFVTGGAQQAIFFALSLVPPGPIVVGRYAYPGTIRAARELGRPIVPIAMDEKGILPTALIEASEGADPPSTIFCMPSLQNPTGATMDMQRREDIVAIARRRDMLVIEDDVHAAYDRSGLPSLAALAPERTLHVTGLSKLMGPAFRVGALGVPQTLRADANRWLQAFQTMPNPMSLRLVSEIVSSGVVARMVERLRDAARDRHALARSVMGTAVVPAAPTALHLWLPMQTVEARSIVAEAAQEGIFLAPPDAFLSLPGDAEAGLRICMGACSKADLKRALEWLATRLSGDATPKECERPIV